jgi:uncharacterized protein YhaN
MRFSRLSLERYGRFEDCELHFRSGPPDLHIIYGANEAGKTTSLSAVSDLLFGFPARSPHNFLFDYSLLRVGATLEDGAGTLECRRKKGTNRTLLDASDHVMDETPLSAMLRGQTRETFGLSFSLDQDALRSGGRAMVEARNDVGRALFAAGSGLTGIADELKRLEGEADAIWAPSTAQRRTFTQAQRQLTEASRTTRESALRPKAWSDAQQTAERARTTLEAARQRRDAVQGELRAADRVRRLAPLVRQHAEQVEALAAHADTIDLGRHREDSGEATISGADDAQRELAAVEQLRAEAAERRGSIQTDPTILARAEDVDQLVADAGAGEKAERDLARLEPGLAAAEAVCLRLRSEAGANADASPPRALAARLRDLARRHGETAVAGTEIAESRADVADRRKRAQGRLDESRPATEATALIAAVDAARALGADADARCETGTRKVKLAAAALPALLARLSPWQGSIEDLLSLPHASGAEVEDARARLADIAAEIRREEEQGQRATDQQAVLALELLHLETGAAVSPEEIASAKEGRRQRWLPIRDHVLTGAPLAVPAEAVAEFESSVDEADQRMELRFTLANASSRLSLVEQNRASQKLLAEQAGIRAEAGRARQQAAFGAWHNRLTSVGLPALDPSRLSTWHADRGEAEDAHRELLNLRSDHGILVARRDAARAALSVALGQADAGGALAPVLAMAERSRQLLEEAAQQHRLAREQLDQVEADNTALDRRQRRVDEDSASISEAWDAALREGSLQVDPVTCDAVLDLLDELREAAVTEADLRRRVEGIRRDARDHVARVGALADACSVPAGATGQRLQTLRDWVAAARNASTLIGSLDEEERRRATKAEELAAGIRAADEALAPLLSEAGCADRAALVLAIERSRARRALADERAATERRIVEDADGLTLEEAVAAVSVSSPEEIAGHIASLTLRLQELNDEVDLAATAHGDARSAFAALDTGGTAAVSAAADAEQAKAELEVLAEHYILKRAQAVTLRWAIEKYRERHQDPLLLRAGALFSTLTAARYSTLRVDADGASPRLLGMRDDGRTMVEVGAMSEGTTDQLFLALRLAALEQSVSIGVRLPFLADDLFVNFDDERAEAGFKVLAEVAMSTQVLFFTHHPHLVQIAKSVVGAELHSECSLG